jgi:hypothetical protein
MWVIPSRRPFYGRMFPQTQEEMRPGLVFSFCAETAEKAPSVGVDHDQWDRCQECYYYRHCYDLGLAEAILSVQLHCDPQSSERLKVTPRLCSVTA